MSALRLVCLLSLFCAAFLQGCAGKVRHSATASVNDTAALQAQVDLYKQLAPRGWDSAQGCDSLLFVSLQHVGLGEAGPIDLAQGEPGRWYRLPGPTLDMFMGLLTYAYHFRRLDIVEGIWTYGKAHSWVMGEERAGPNNRTVLSPNMITLVASIIYRLGGTDHPERNLFSTYETAPGYVSHLTLLQIALLGEMHGGLSTSELNALGAISQHMSQSPLVHALIHKYTDGDQSEAIRLLTTIWPKDRLPTNRDWSEPWRTQRSDGDSGLRPGPYDQPHSGGDFLFAAGIVLGTI
jgi:hypothetical protein